MFWSLILTINKNIGTSTLRQGSVTDQENFI